MDAPRSAKLAAIAKDVREGFDPFAEPERIMRIREAVRNLCSQFPDAYWRDLDRRRDYPEAFVQALTEVIA